MSEIIKMRSRNQITLPKKLLDALNIEEGDNLEVYIEDDRLVIVPVIAIEKNQSWFWTEEWQIAEQEAQKEINAKKLKEFNNIDDVLEWLDSEEEE
ncbi:TPA: AbrB/MazE/SpoVT family DNA-binding domain-containing protein [Bacillus cereus]